MQKIERCERDVFFFQKMDKDLYQKVNFLNNSLASLVEDKIKMGKNIDLMIQKNKKRILLNWILKKIFLICTLIS